MDSVSGIAAYATALSNAQIQEQVGMRVAKKSLDAAKQQGQAAIALLQSAAQVQRQSVGEPHKGNLLDVMA